MEAAASEIDGALRSLTQDLAGNLYRNQFGVRGEVANIAATTITLTNPSDIVRFEVGMTLVSVAAGTPGAATTGGPSVIQSTETTERLKSTSLPVSRSAMRSSNWATLPTVATFLRWLVLRAGYPPPLHSRATTSSR